VVIPLDRIDMILFSTKTDKDKRGLIGTIPYSAAPSSAYCRLITLMGRGAVRLEALPEQTLYPLVDSFIQTVTVPPGSREIPETIHSFPNGCLEPLLAVRSSLGAPLPVHALPLFGIWLSADILQADSILAKRSSHKPLLRQVKLLAAKSASAQTMWAVIAFAVVGPRSYRQQGPPLDRCCWPCATNPPHPLSSMPPQLQLSLPWQLSRQAVTPPDTPRTGHEMEELSVDEAIHFMQDWSFQLSGGCDDTGISLTGFPYAGVHPELPQAPVLVLGRPTFQSPRPRPHGSTSPRRALVRRGRRFLSHSPGGGVTIRRHGARRQSHPIPPSQEQGGGSGPLPARLQRRLLQARPIQG
jgi:hypothetical protein